MDFYELARGPLATLAFAVMIIGICYRLVVFYTKGTNPKLLYPKENITNGIKSILFGIIPFATRFMRERPVLTVFTVLFHISAVVVPLFFSAHIILWFESYGVIWSGISDGLADAMTLFVIAACIFFFVRRVAVPEVKMVSTPSDFILLVLIFVSFLSGFLATHQMGPYRATLIFHVLSSDLLIAIIPFSRLWHMAAYPFSRYYMGADFGQVLASRDW